MALIASLAVWALLTASAAEPANPEAREDGAVRRAAAALAERAVSLGAPASERVIAVHVGSPESPELARAVETELVAALGARGLKAVWALSSQSVDDAEAEARAAGADQLLRLTASVQSSELAVAGDVVPTWVNFWAGREPIRAPGGGAIAARALVDAEVLTLARLPLLGPGSAAPGEAAGRLVLRPLARLPGRVVALAIGDVDGDGIAELAVLSESCVLLLRSDGSEVARRELSGLPRSPRPPREPAGAIAIGRGRVDSAEVRIAAHLFSRASGELLELVDGVLVPVAGLDASTPLASGGDGDLLGGAVPGWNTYAAGLRGPAGAEALLPFSPVSVVGNPRPAAAGEPAWLAIAADGAAALLGSDLRPLERRLPAIGAGAALGDFDGDGRVDLAVSELTLTGDRLRVHAMTDVELTRPLFESQAIDGGFVAGSAGKLKPDGRDQAVLAAWLPDGATRLFVLEAGQ